MTNITLDWTDFKDKVDYHELSISYADKNGNYYLFTYKDTFEYVCVLDKLDADDFMDNYQQEATLI